MLVLLKKKNLGEKNKLDILYINKSDYELVLIPIEEYKDYQTLF